MQARCAHSPRRLPPIRRSPTGTTISPRLMKPSVAGTGRSRITRRRLRAMPKAGRRGGCCSSGRSLPARCNGSRAVGRSRLACGHVRRGRHARAIASDALLHCALKQIWLCNAPLELMLTGVRAQLSAGRGGRAPDFAETEEKTIALFGAIAQQCFINDYVYAQSDAETAQANELRGLLCERLKAGTAISPLCWLAVAAYCPLHTLPDAQSLLRADEGGPLGDLLRQQVREPLEEHKTGRIFRC